MLDDSCAVNMQGEDVFECTNGKCQVFTFQYARGRGGYS